MPIRSRALFGFDFFLSYATSDAAAYASALAEQLRKRRFRVYFDRAEFGAGPGFKTRLTRDLRASSVLLLLATQAARKSPHVRFEVEAFAGTGRPIIPINVDGAYCADEWPDIGRRDLAWVNETVANVTRGIPAPPVLNAIANSLRLTRRDILRLRIITGVAVVLVFFLIVAITSWRNAVQQRNTALGRQLAAQATLLLERDPNLVDRAALLAVESIGRNPSLAGDQALRAALQFLPREVARLHHPSEVTDFVFSPDGLRLLTVTNGTDASRASILEWEIATRRVVARLAVDSERVSIAYRSTGPPVILEQWYRNGQYFYEVIEFPSGRKLLKFSAASDVPVDGWRGTRLAEAPKPHLLRFQQIGAAWDRQEIRIRERIAGVLFSADGNHVVVSAEHALYVCQLFGRVRETRLSNRGRFNGEPLPVAVSISAKDFKIVLADLFMDDRGDAVVLDNRGREVIRLPHEGRSSGIAMSADGELLTTLSLRRGVRVWNIASGDEVARLSHDDEVFRVAFSNDRSQIATAAGHDIRIFSLGRPPWIQIRHDALISSLAFSPDGRELATASEHISGRGGVRLFDGRSGRELYRFTLHCCANLVQFSHDGKYLGAIEDEPEGRRLTIWDLKERSEVARLPLENSRNSSFTFTASDALLVGTTGERGVRLRMLRPPLFTSALEMRTVPGKLDIFPPDGRYVMTVNENLFRLSDPQSGQEVWTVPERPTGTAHSSLSTTYAALVIWTGSVDIWNIRTRQLQKHITQDHFVTRAIFSPDEHYIATASEDGTARVWSLQTGEEVARMTHRNGVWALAFSPDNRYIASGSADGIVYVWPWRSGDLIAAACDMLTRNLTVDEWRQYMGTEPYHKSCLNLP